jgi:hypothetical protein
MNNVKNHQQKQHSNETVGLIKQEIAKDHYESNIRDMEHYG